MSNTLRPLARTAANTPSTSFVHRKARQARQNPPPSCDSCDRTRKERGSCPVGTAPWLFRIYKDSGKLFLSSFQRGHLPAALRVVGKVGIVCDSRRCPSLSHSGHPSRAVGGLPAGTASTPNRRLCTQGLSISCELGVRWWRFTLLT